MKTIAMTMDSLCKRAKNWNISALLTIWLFSCLTCNSYGISHGLYYAWLSSFLLIGVAIVRLRESFRFEISKISWITAGPGILLISLGFWYFVAACFHSQHMMGLKYLVKFGVIGAAYFALLILDFKIKEIRNAFLIIAILNVVPILFYFIPGSEEMGIAALTFGGRMSSVLNPYGSLWKTGIYLAIFAIWQVYVQPSFLGILSLGVGLLLCALDGGRVSLIVVLIAMGILFYFSISQNKKKSFLKVSSLVAILMFIVPILWLKRPPFIHRWIKAYLVAYSYDSNMMPEYNEEIRVKMFFVVKDVIRNAQFFGHGIYSTGLASGEGFQSLHNAYFQVLGDVGYGGFLIFCALILLPYLKIKKVILAMTAEENLWPLGVISLVWFVVFIFHPISTELYEWVGFMLATSTVARFIQGREKLESSKKKVI